MIGTHQEKLIAVLDSFFARLASEGWADEAKEWATLKAAHERREIC